MAGQLDSCAGYNKGAILGYVHIGLGRNTLLGGTSLSKIHIDGIMTMPTVELDGKTIVRDGRVLV